MLELNTTATDPAGLYVPADHATLPDISGRRYFAVWPLIVDNYDTGSPGVFLPGVGSIPMFAICRKATGNIWCIYNNNGSSVAILNWGLAGMPGGEERYGWCLARCTDASDGGNPRINGFEFAWYDPISGLLQVNKGVRTAPAAPSTSASDSVGFGSVVTSGVGFYQNTWSGTYSGLMRVGALSIRVYAADADVPTFQEIIDRFWPTGVVPSAGAHLDVDDVWSPVSDPTDFWAMHPHIPQQGLDGVFTGGGNGITLTSTHNGLGPRFTHYSPGSGSTWWWDVNVGQSGPDSGSRAAVITGEHITSNPLRLLEQDLQIPTPIDLSGRPFESPGVAASIANITKPGNSTFVVWSDQSYVVKPDTYYISDRSAGSRREGGAYGLIDVLGDACGGRAIQSFVSESDNLYAEQGGGRTGYTTDFSGEGYNTMVNCDIFDTAEGNTNGQADFSKFGVGTRQISGIYGSGGGTAVGSSPGSTESIYVSINVDDTPGLSRTDTIEMWAVLFAFSGGKESVTVYGNYSDVHNDRTGFSPTGEITGEDIGCNLPGASYPAAAGSTALKTVVTTGSLLPAVESQVAASDADRLSVGLPRWVVYNETQGSIDTIQSVNQVGGTYELEHYRSTRKIAAALDTILLSARAYKVIKVTLPGDATKKYRNLRVEGTGAGRFVCVGTGYYNVTQKGTLTHFVYGGSVGYADYYDGSSQPGAVLDMIDALEYNPTGWILGVASDSGAPTAYETVIQALKSSFSGIDIVGYGQGVIGGTSPTVSPLGVINNFLQPQHDAFAEACENEGIPYLIPQGVWGSLGDKIEMAGQPDTVHHAAEAGILWSQELVNWLETLGAKSSFWKWRLTNPLA